MRARKLVSLAVGILVVTGCARQEDAVHGQVFIVTAGRENVKLGLVTVGLLDEAAAREHIARKQAQARALVRGRDSLLADARAALVAAQRQRSAVASHIYRLNNTDPWTGTDYDEMVLRAQARANQGPLQQQLHDTTQLVSQRERELAALTAPAPWDSGGFYLNDLPSPVATTQTDADGMFELKVPKRGQYVLAARAERTTPGGVESYAWLVAVTADEAHGGRVLLSNQNMTNANAPSSLVHTRW